MNFEELKEWLNEKLKIDPLNLDDESLRTAQIHGEIMNLYTDEGLVLKDMLRKQKQIKLQRWKYYNNKQTPEYYKKHGPIKETIVKSDVGLYMDADKQLHDVDALVDKQKAKVDLLESALKQVNQRTFIIKDTIQWRMFISGS